MIYFTGENLKRAMWKRSFMFAVMGIALLELLYSFPDMVYGWMMTGGNLRQSENVVHLFQISGGNTLYNLLTITVCMIPFVSCFCEDKENKLLTGIVTRGSAGRYAASTMFTCGISSFLCMVAGELIYLAIVLVLYPVADGYGYMDTWSSLVDGHYYLYLAMRILQRGFRGAFFGMISLMISSFVSNRYVILSSPTIIYYVLLYVTTDVALYFNNRIVDTMRISAVYFTFQFGLDRELFSLFYTFLYTVATGVLMWMLYRMQVKRSLR